VPNEILATDHAVQSNVFNNEFEHQDVTVHDYLNKFSHDIITFKMCDKILDIWHSQKVEWHIERGIKLQADGSACVNGRPVTIQVLSSMNPNQKKAFHKEAKQSCFCISSKIHGVLTAHQASSGMTPRDK